MADSSIVQRLIRERALWRYILALENGNLDVVAVVLQKAEQDADLDHMIGGLHETYQTEEELQQLFAEERGNELEEGIHKSGLSKQYLASFKQPHHQKNLIESDAVRIILAAMLMLVLIGGLFLYIGMQQSTAPRFQSESYKWCVISGPQANGTGSGSLLGDLVAFSPKDIWAISDAEKSPSTQRPDFLHWDGKTWQTIVGPDLNALAHQLMKIANVPQQPWQASLSSIDATSSDDIWAVGTLNLLKSDKSAVQISTTLIEHWDGQNWKLVASPNGIVPGAANMLRSVTALSTTDVWAAGYTNPPGYTGQTSSRVTALVEHWDGMGWSIIPLPETLAHGTLKTISAKSASDIWITGERDSGTSPVKSLIGHWNGQIWSSSSLASAFITTTIREVATIAQKNAWAVGSFSDTPITLSDQSTSSRLAHWDGHRWGGVIGAKINEPTSNLVDIVAQGVDNIWAVGSVRTTNSTYYPLIEHWDGQNWHAVSSSSGYQGLLKKVILSNKQTWMLGLTTTTASTNALSFTGSFLQYSC